MPSTTDRVIADRYALQESLGRGAMGAVWAADDRVLRRRVALKEIEVPPSLEADDRSALGARVMREARAAARLAHPGAVTVFDVVEEDGSPWIVMEYVDAPTLEEIVRERGPLSVERVAAVGLELVDVLDAAHREGIVHRDVKPGNVMCPDVGRVKLADFGIASMQDDPKITATGLILGSPAYMAPEQAQSATSGPASDLWSLGVTLYFAVEGRAPFDKGQALPTLTAVVGEPAPRPDHAGALAPLLMALLEKDPPRRPPASEVRRQLTAIRGGADAGATSAPTVVEARAATPTRLETGAQPASATPAPERAVRARPPMDRSFRPWGIALAILVLLAVGAVLIPRALDGETEGGTAGQQEDRSGSDRGSSGDSDSSGSGDGRAEPPPQGWVGHTGPNGYTLYHPPGWEERPVSDVAVDLVNPDDGSYMRVEYTDAPGDDVLGTLQGQAEGFGSDHANYENVGVESVEYRGYEAALWEYTYEDEGAALHAFNLQFVTGDFGYALNFQTHEQDWAGSADLWETFLATFVPVE